MDTNGFPQDLVILRHGESRGNTPADLGHQAYHDPRTELTAVGKEQAKAAGKWIRENVGDKFDLCYVSNFIRAMETASKLGLKEANWLTDGRLIERSWGELEKLTRADRRREFLRAVSERSLDVYLWAPNGGESLQAIMNRLYPLYEEIKRQVQTSAGGRGPERAIISTHGGIIWATRVLIEHLPPEKYRELNLSTDPHDRVRHGQIFHYSRVDTETGEVTNDLCSMRIACPLDGFTSEWFKIPPRQVFSGKGLLQAIKNAKNGGETGGK